MPRTSAPMSTRTGAVTRRYRRASSPLLPLVLCALIGAALFALTGCSNLGEFNEGAIIDQAERYFAQKYGTHTRVVDLWEDRSYQLFGYRSGGRAFCTMEDGTTVLVDFEEGPLGDNREQDEIIAAYEQRFREALAAGEAHLERAGYAVSLFLINGMPYAEEGFFDGRISQETWQRNEDADEESASFFYAPYTDDERFFEREASRVSLGIPAITLEISGADANYAAGFPTNVPEEPGWVTLIDETCQSLLSLTNGNPETKVAVYQTGGYASATDENAESGLLGELSPFDHVDGAGNWLIVDWIPLGKGVYLTSREPGVRLHEGDMALTEVEGLYTFEGLTEDGSLEAREARAFYPEVFETYQLDVSSNLFASLPAHVQDKGWFGVRVAYDNKDPETGLAQAGITPSELEPSLYTIEDNPAAKDSEDEPPLEIAGMRTTTLENGFQFVNGTMHGDTPMLFIRV